MNFIESCWFYRSGNEQRSTVQELELSIPKARLSDIGRVLADGGFVRFVWATGVVTLHFPNGSEWLVDGRSYQSIVHNSRFCKNERGSTVQGDLVIEWTAQ